MQTAIHDVGQARRFLALALPWPDETISGVFNVVTKAPPKGDHKAPFWNHVGVRSIDDAIRAIHHQITKRGATDIYGWMALGNLATAEPFHPTRPDSWLKGNRLAENAVWFKSIFLDVDFGPTKKYADLPSAQLAFDEFISHAKLPKPNLMVGSGHGFHCHWTLTEPVPADKWQDLAGRLIGAVQLHGLHCDSEVTLDRARILRVPGTWNNKDPTNPVKVELLREEPAFFLASLEAALASYQPAVGKAYAPRASILPPGMTPRPALPGAEMGEGIDQPHSDIWIDEVDCPLIVDALDTNGRDHANPLWHQMVWMASFCEEGRITAHDLSSGHPSYSEDEVDREFDRAVKTRQARPELGWTSCRKFHDAGGEAICKGCPHLAEDKSPFNFTLRSYQTIPPGELVGLQIGEWLPPLPDGFIRDSNKRVCQIVPSDEDGQPPVQVPIASNPVYHAWLTDGPKELHFTYLDVSNSNTAYKKLARIELSRIARPVEMYSHFYSQGFMIAPGKAKTAGSFFVGWVDELKKVQENKYFDKTSFGWVEHENRITGFAYNNIAWAKTPSPAPSLEGMSRDYTPRGDLAPWQAATKLVTDRGRPELEILLAIGFASPLVGLLSDTAKGIQIFAWSRDTGAGKTTALSLAAAVWGNPILTMQQANDTFNSIDKKMGDLRNLPIIWDEFKTASDTESFINMIFRASSGKSKSRLSSEIGYRPVHSWATILACASNAPMLDRVYKEVGRTNAGALRIFEYEIPHNDARMVTSEVASPLMHGITLNYGRAGEAYAKWLGENFEAIREDLYKFRLALEAKLEHPTQERFWSATITVLVKGAQYAKQLGLVDFHPKEMLAFCQKLIGHMRSDANRMIPDPTSNAGDLKELLNSFRSDMLAYETIRFEQIPMGRGRPTNFTYKPYQYNAATFSKLSVVESDQNDVIRFSGKALADWLNVRRQRQDNFGSYFPNEIIRAAVKLLGATVKPQGRLAPGHNKDVGEQRVIEISTSRHPDLKSTFK